MLFKLSGITQRLFLWSSFTDDCITVEYSWPISSYVLFCLKQSGQATTASSHCHSIKNCWPAGKASIKEQQLLRTQHFILSWQAHWPADPGFCSMEWLLALTRRVFLALTRRYFKLTPKISRALVELSSVVECNIKGVLFPLNIFRFLYWRCFPFKTLFWSWCVKCDNFGVCLMFFKPGSQ